MLLVLPHLHSRLVTCSILCLPLTTVNHILDRFLVYAGTCTVGSSLILFPIGSKMVNSLYGAKEARRGVVVVKRAELKKAIQICIASQYGGDPEIAVRDDVEDRILGSIGAERLAEMTKRRFDAVFEEVLRESLREEYAEDSCNK